MEIFSFQIGINQVKNFKFLQNVKTHNFVYIKKI